MIARPPQFDWGDYAFPCFRFAKDLKQAPAQIAEALTQSINDNIKNWPWLVETNALKGFVNIRINQTALASYILPLVKTKEYLLKPNYEIPAKKNVMIEYSGANTHKNFHIGHVRNVCLGDCLSRLYAYCGFNVNPVNYIGDEGTHVAECLWYLAKQSNEPEKLTERIEWLEAAYVGAKNALAEANPEMKKTMQAEVGAVHHQLEAKKGPYFERWQQTKAWCMENFHNLFRWLDAHFEHDFFESDMTEESQAIVDEYLAKGTFVADQGAIGIDLEKYKLGFCLLRKSNGATLYATKDLALARQKFEQYNVDKSVYVVGAEQIRHFQQVFKTLELMGFEQAKACHHLSYGFVRLPDGKMSTRKGSAVHFTLVRDEILAELDTFLEKYADEWGKEELLDTRHKLAVCAIKYGMLCSDPNKEIIFDIKDWLSFEGNTGPYLMYSFTRTQSILKKASEQGFVPQCSEFDTYTQNEEHALLRCIYDFNKVVLQACENYHPTALCTHLFYMCKEFNRFYANVPVLKATDKTQVEARLILIEAFGVTLQQGLKLLGISTIERM